MKTFAFALAAVAIVASAAPVSAQDYRISYGDLDLGVVSGADRLDHRIARQARSACNGQRGLAFARCRADFRAAAMEALPVSRQADYARARGGRILAMVPTYQG